MICPLTVVARNDPLCPVNLDEIAILVVHVLATVAGTNRSPLERSAPCAYRGQTMASRQIGDQLLSQTDKAVRGQDQPAIRLTGQACHRSISAVARRSWASRAGVTGLPTSPWRGRSRWPSLPPLDLSGSAKELGLPRRGHGFAYVPLAWSLSLAKLATARSQR